jgi:hypothetical protein
MIYKVLAGLGFKEKKKKKTLGSVVSSWACVFPVL